MTKTWKEMPRRWLHAQTLCSNQRFVLDLQIILQTRNTRECCSCCSGAITRLVKHSVHLSQNIGFQFPFTWVTCRMHNVFTITFACTVSTLACIDVWIWSVQVGPFRAWMYIAHYPRSHMQVVTWLAWQKCIEKYEALPKADGGGSKVTHKVTSIVSLSS